MAKNTQKSEENSLTSDGEFNIGISREDLRDIVNNKMRTVSYDVPQENYERLSAANKRALKHLVKAAAVLDDVFLKQDHPDNIRAKEAFERAAANNDEYTQMAFKLFKVFNGLEGYDMYAEETEPLRIFSDKQLQPGKGFYPQDITKEELADYIVEHPEQAAAIFSLNTVVIRDDERLKAVPYSVAYRDEMEAAAAELFKASAETDHEDFAKYLRLQAQALVNDSDAEMQYKADAAWVKLEDTPLEFTISRESYEDALSGDVTSDPRVKKLLDTYGIKAKSKDTISTRVGIVNPESYEAITRYRKNLNGFGKQMPLLGQYKQDSSINLSLADVDLVAITGGYAADRGGMTYADNLPNDDKLAVQLGAGGRIVFHRQKRQTEDRGYERKFLNALIAPEQQKWYDPQASFLFTIGHELAHSLGPRETKDGRDKYIALGEWGDILEENKADIASIVMTDYFVRIGEFDEEQANKIYLTWFASELPDKKPITEEPHRYRMLMQLNYFREHGAISFGKGKKFEILPEKFADTARQMLEEIIAFQIEGDAKKAGAFAKKYGKWDEDYQYMADVKNNLGRKSYTLVRQPLMEKLLTP